MKKSAIFIIVILLILAGVYLSKNQIKSRIGISAAPSPAQTITEKVPTPTPSDAIYFIKTNSTKDSHLTDEQGRSLYTYDKDTMRVSTCVGACATTWPAYTVSANLTKVLPANISVITRADGSKQYAWKGKPLYYYSGDTKTEDINGNNFGTIWHIAKP